MSTCFLTISHDVVSGRMRAVPVSLRKTAAKKAATLYNTSNNPYTQQNPSVINLPHPRASHAGLRAPLNVISMQ